ncbi:MAG: hypothetical protein ABJN36_18785 [Cyclobacteriaceae bacterium]
MKPESLAAVKRELKHKSPEELEAICLRLAKYKLENKELLSFLLFYSQNPEDYVREVKEEISVQFAGVNTANLYWAKKSVRKILRLTNKHIKYIGDKAAEVDLLIYFCEELANSGISIKNSTALFNLYERQIIKIEKAISKLHEDLQYDWNQQLDDKNLRLSYF